eukprot:1151148-Pelagomonas_calceolata.AAC.1
MLAQKRAFRLENVDVGLTVCLFDSVPVGLTVCTLLSVRGQCTWMLRDCMHAQRYGMILNVDVGR